MTKARILANLISDNAELADGQISVAEVVGAAPTANPTFTGAVTSPQINLVNPNNSGKVLVLDVDQGDVISVGDLEIYDDRTSGIGYMLRTDTSTQAIGADAVVIMDRTGQKSLANFAYSGDTGTAKLRYWDSNGGYDKLETSLAGISVVGTVTADGLTVDGGATINEKLTINKQGEAFTLRSGGASTQNYISIGRTGEDARITMSGGANNALQTSAAGDLVIGANNNILLGRIGSPYINLNSTGVVLNELGGADKDFRVESDNSSYALFVDAGDDTVSVGRNSGAGKLNVRRTSSGTSLFLYNSNNDYPSGSTGYSDIDAGFYDYLTGGDNAGGTARVRFESANAFHSSRSARVLIMASPADGTNTAREMARFQPDMITFNDLTYDQDFRVESSNNSHMLFVDAGGEYVNVNTSITTMGGKLNVNGNKGTGSGIPSQQLVVADSTALREGGGGAIQFNGIYDSNNSMTTAGSIEGYKRNATSGDYGFGLWFKSRTHGGPNQERLYMDEDKTVFNDIGANTDFRIESDGNTHALFVDGGTSGVGINYSTPGVTKSFAGTAITSNFHVNSDSSINGAFFQYAGGGIFVGLQNDVSSGTRYFLTFGNSSGSRYGDITSNGSTMTYGGTSDYRLKTNVQPMSGSISRVKQLNPVTFDWIPSGISTEGFLAHEVQSVVSDAATGIKDEVDENGNPVYQQVDPRHVVPLLTSALQEAITKIETLEARITALENA